MRALGDLQRQGKIRYFGVSNYKSWRVAENLNLCDRMGIDRPIVSQPYYTHSIRVARSSICRSARTMGRRRELLAARARRAHRQYQPGADAPRQARGPRRQAMIKRSFARRLWQPRRSSSLREKRWAGAKPSAVAWVLNNKLISSVVAGPRTETQWDDYVKALDLKFWKEDEAFVNELVVTGHAAAPGYNDPAYPIEGRVARA